MNATSPTHYGLSKTTRRLLWLLLLLLLVIAFVFVVTPAVLIQPFRSQTARAVEVSYVLKRWSPIVTAVVVLSIVAMGFLLWRNSRRWWLKSLLVILLLLSIAPAWFARQNHFEWMFNPLMNSAYAKVNEASFVQPTDMVLAIKFANEAVAYPVRQMAYHHLVQDVVGGVPIVATY